MSAGIARSLRRAEQDEYFNARNGERERRSGLRGAWDGKSVENHRVSEHRPRVFQRKRPESILTPTGRGVWIGTRRSWANIEVTRTSVSRTRWERNAAANECDGRKAAWARFVTHPRHVPHAHVTCLAAPACTTQDRTRSSGQGANRYRPTYFSRPRGRRARSRARRAPGPRWSTPFRTRGMTRAWSAFQRVGHRVEYGDVSRSVGTRGRLGRACCPRCSRTPRFGVEALTQVEEDSRACRRAHRARGADRDGGRLINVDESVPRRPGSRRFIRATTNSPPASSAGAHRLASTSPSTG